MTYLTLCILVIFYIVLLLVPLFFATRWAFKFSLWRLSAPIDVPKLQRKVQKRVEKNRIANMVVNMPIYNEDPEALILAVESVCASIYPKHRITVYLSFDNEEEDVLVQTLMKHLVGRPTQPGGWAKCLKLTYKDVNFVINMFPHGGKRNAQAMTFRQIAHDFRGRELDSFVLYLDSDIILYQDAMLEFLRAMEKNKKLVGMTGFISAISSAKANFLWYFQDCEYVVGQVISRSLEAGLGGVTCLPGALTIIRLKEMNKAAQTYFSELPTEDIFDFHRYHLGEDRFLTHLLMQQSKSYSIGFCPTARAKTVAPDNWASFLKQRRRWLLGAFSNEIYFLADLNLWDKVPFLIIYKLLDFSSRSSSFFIYLVVFQIVTGVYFNPIQSLIIWTPLILSWIFIGIVAISIRRHKAFFMYPITILLNPWLYFFINIYAIWTWEVRSWGGPRVVVEEDPKQLLEVPPSPEPQTASNSDTVAERKSDESDTSTGTAGSLGPGPVIHRERSYNSIASTTDSHTSDEHPTFMRRIFGQQQQGHTTASPLSAPVLNANTSPNSQDMIEVSPKVAVVPSAPAPPVRPPFYPSLLPKKD
ncbi:hypothetical protein HDU91_005361 [Kappamyces sp. JEL0680]|nr:hypothetical protein HDU91_005361 [Kappamyces sp. JEL0680]